MLISLSNLSVPPWIIEHGELIGNARAALFLMYGMLARPLIECGFLLSHTGTVLGLTSCTVGSAFNQCMLKAVSFAPESQIKACLGCPKKRTYSDTCVLCTYQSLSGLSGVKVAAFGIHQFKTNRTI